MSGPSEKEMADLPTHVLLCAQRYETLKRLLIIVAVLSFLNALGLPLPEIAKLMIGL